MALKKIETTINGIRFESTTFPARVALNLNFRILQLLGRGLGSIPGMKFDKENAAALALNVIGSICGGLDIPGAEALLFDLLKGVIAYKDGEVHDLSKPAVFDDFFGQNITGIIDVVKWIIAENFPDFFGERSPLTGIIAAGTAAMKTPEESPKHSRKK